MFFYAAKILWLIGQPSNLIALVIATGTVLLVTRWQRLGRRVLALGVVALLVVGFLPLGDIAVLPLENRFTRPDLSAGPPVTGVIILGGAADGRASRPPREIAGLNESAERFTEGVALARRLPQARIVFTGGSAALVGGRQTESVPAARLLLALGVDKERLVLESRSRDTYENAMFTRALLDPKPGERWLLVTSGWHMPRAIGCFRKAGFPVEAWPVDYRTTGSVMWVVRSVSESLRRIDFVVREYLGLLFYYLTGRTDALLPGP